MEYLWPAKSIIRPLGKPPAIVEIPTLVDNALQRSNLRMQVAKVQSVFYHRQFDKHAGIEQDCHPQIDWT